MEVKHPFHHKVVALLNQQRLDTAITLRDGASEDGTEIVGCKYSGADFQLWRLVQVRFDEVWPAFTILNVATATALTLSNGSAQPQTAIQGWAARATPNQLWYICSNDPNHVCVRFQNVESATFIDLDCGSAIDGTRIQGYPPTDPFHANPNQIWKIRVLQ